MFTPSMPPSPARRTSRIALCALLYLATAGNDGCPAAAPPGAQFFSFLSICLGSFDSNTALSISGQDDDETPACVDAASTAQIGQAVADWAQRTRGAASVRLGSILVTRTSVGPENTAASLTGHVVISVAGDPSKRVQSPEFTLTATGPDTVEVDISTFQEAANELLNTALADNATNFDVQVVGCADAVPAFMDATVTANFVTVLSPVDGQCQGE